MIHTAKGKASLVVVHSLQLRAATCSVPAQRAKIVGDSAVLEENGLEDEMGSRMCGILSWKEVIKKQQERWK